MGYVLPCHLISSSYPVFPNIDQSTHFVFVVSAQRRQYKIVTSGQTGSTSMTLERAKKLVDIGFEWSTINPNHVTWETRFEELRQFVVSSRLLSNP